MFVVGKRYQVSKDFRVASCINETELEHGNGWFTVLAVYNEGTSAKGRLDFGSTTWSFDWNWTTAAKKPDSNPVRPIKAAIATLECGKYDVRTARIVLQAIELLESVQEA